VIVFEVQGDELLESLTRQAAEAGIANGAIVSLIGAADEFTVSTMPADNPGKDIVTKYAKPAEMNGTGEICSGTVHIHATMAVEGDLGVSGHLHRAVIGAWFARAYVIPLDDPHS
jgi:uncharacterized protein